MIVGAQRNYGQTADQIKLVRMAQLGLCALIIAAGCTTLRDERDALSRFERTQEELRRASRSDFARPSPEDAKPDASGWPKISDFSPSNVKSTFDKAIGRGPNPEEADRLYANAGGLYDEALQARQQNQPELAAQKFREAAADFKSAAKKYPQSTTERNALFLSGEAYFFADDYVNANEQYELLLKAQPNSLHMDEIQRRRFAIAQYWLENYREQRPAFYEVNLTDSSKPWNSMFSNSMRVFDRIRLDDPTGKLADDATMALASAYFAEGKYGKSDEYFTDLRKAFPSSEHQYKAHFIGLKAKLLTYQGPDYGGTALEESEKLITTIRKQFPVEAEKDREYLAKSLAEVRFRKAEREFLKGEYHEAKAEYGAAKYYYVIVLKEYPDTKFADETRRRLASIEGRPAVPPQRFSWLAKAFPREENVRPLIATDKPKTKKR